MPDSFELYQMTFSGNSHEANRKIRAKIDVDESSVKPRQQTANSKQQTVNSKQCTADTVGLNGLIRLCIEWNLSPVYCLLLAVGCLLCTDSFFRISRICL